MLGKWKRDTIVIPRESAEESPNKIVPGNGDSQDLFRQHFEARFKPLEEALTRVENPLLTCLDEDSGSEWDGISDRDTRQTAEVIEHLASSHKTQVVSDKQARKEFMVCV
jgi:hypothetical protein